MACIQVGDTPKATAFGKKNNSVLLLALKQLKSYPPNSTIRWMARYSADKIKVRLLKAWMRRLCFQDLSAG